MTEEKPTWNEAFSKDPDVRLLQNFLLFATRAGKNSKPDSAENNNTATSVIQEISPNKALTWPEEN